VRIAGYLRYAHLRRQWRDGGEKLNPVLQVSLPADGATGRSYELAAFDRTSHRAEDGMIQFVWLERSSLVDTLPTDSRAMLHIEVPETGVTLDVPITAEALVGSTGAYTEIKGTDFSYRIQNVQDNLVLPGRGNTFSVAIVGIKAPDTEFTRWVGDRPELTRDMPARGGDAHGGGRDQLKEVDPRISMTYRPWSAPILFAAHPNALFLVVNGPDGRVLGREVEVGERVEVVPGLTVRADALWTRAVSQIRPFVVPPASRRRNVGDVFSMIRLEVDTGSDIQSKWLRFNQYVFPNRQYAYEGRFTYSPERFRLSDGSTVEVIFSRQRRRLPNPIALEEFALDAHLGGYTGQTSTIRNYVSKLRFLDNGEWTAPASIRVNAPTEYGGYWYFQSTWDKPPSGNPTGGMNYTGLGVGNRNGVYIQLAGCCISAAGMLFAFYVKPMLKRRRLERLRTETDRPQGVDVDQPPSVLVSQTVEV
jgi:hypothetical protein